ncbi:AEC family transporter [Sebaldella sp. S0638]|uniref:AEC family transporter n=1 Tax=Sebaldella sp. S0638 TaxID=2957809 RepID=UPI00209CE8D7|nr:AEC family transporter [Sebaldella sp. S0638]MCP1225552.1 AEC family transporter [Sebaldella sp. S0638]
MIDNFIFTINAVLPVFIMISLGYIFKRINLINENFISTANKFVYMAAITAYLFRSTAMTNFHEIIDLKFILFITAATSLSFLSVWLIAELLFKDKSSVGTFVQGSFRGNFAFIGIPMVISILGNEGAAKTSLVIMFVIPIYNILSVFILSIRSSKKKKLKIKRILMDVLKNPLIISIMFGIVFSLLNIKIPYLLDKPLESLGSISTPLALIVIGGSFSFRNAGTKLKPALLAALLKTTIVPSVVIFFAILSGLRGGDLIIIFVMAAAPTAISSYILSVIMDGDSDLAASIIIFSTIITAFTNTLGIYLFKSFGVI